MNKYITHTEENTILPSQRLYVVSDVSDVSDFRNDRTGKVLFKRLGIGYPTVLTNSSFGERNVRGTTITTNESDSLPTGLVKGTKETEDSVT